MERSGEQLKKGGGGGGGSGEETAKTKGLPVESSPYTQYKDIDDYKRQGYGTEGHQQPQEGRGAGGTDAPTPSGAVPTVSSQHARSNISPTDALNRQGVP